MKRFATYVLATWMFALVLFVGPSDAHKQNPLRRIVVQVEDRAIVIMVVYRPGSESLSEAFALGGAHNGVRISSKRLQTQMARVALAPIDFSLNKQVFKPTRMEVKVIPDNHEKFTAVMLLEVIIPAGTHTLSARVGRASGKHRFEFVDKRVHPEASLSPEKKNTKSHASMELTWEAR